MVEAERQIDARLGVTSTLVDKKNPDRRLVGRENQTSWKFFSFPEVPVTPDQPVRDRANPVRGDGADLGWYLLKNSYLTSKKRIHRDVLIKALFPDILPKKGKKRLESAMKRFREQSRKVDDMDIIVSDHTSVIAGWYHLHIPKKHYRFYRIRIQNNDNVLLGEEAEIIFSEKPLYKLPPITHPTPDPLLDYIHPPMDPSKSVDALGAIPREQKGNKEHETPFLTYLRNAGEVFSGTAGYVTRNRATNILSHLIETKPVKINAFLNLLIREQVLDLHKNGVVKDEVFTTREQFLATAAIFFHYLAVADPFEVIPSQSSVREAVFRAREALLSEQQHKVALLLT